MLYFYLRGAAKAIRLLADDEKTKMNEGAYEMLTEGIKAAQSPKKKGLEDKKTNIQMASRKGQKGRTIDNPIKISITIGNKVITEMQ